MTDVTRIVRPSTYRSNKVTSALVLWAALLALASWRRGEFATDQRTLITLGVATAVIILSASVAPDVVTYLLLAVVVVMLLQNADALAQLVDQGGARLRQTLGGS